MLINGLQLGGVLLYAGPEITGGQLVLSLVGIALLVYGIILSYKFYLNKKSQELLSKHSDNLSLIHI